MSAPELALGTAVDDIVGGYRQLLSKRLLVLLLLAAIIVGSLLLDFTIGPSGLTLAELWQTLVQREAADPATAVIVWDIRLPYALIAVAAGLALGLAGAEMQTVLNNPLASPFTLGLQQAAAFGAALALVVDLSLPGVPGGWSVAVNAFLVCLLAVWLIDTVTRVGGMSTSGVVLFGIALMFSFEALTSMMKYIADADALQGLVLWTMGSLSRATWPKVAALFALVAIVLPLSVSNAWRLTALRLGEDRAASFGINVRRLRRNALIRASLLTALTVSFVGTIGFVGLVAPHIARRLVGEDHRFYLPSSALIGAVILSLASLASRSLIPGTIIPVGIVTALVGIPFFISIVFRQGRLS